jgi:SAM-dependent methyltransferase
VVFEEMIKPIDAERISRIDNREILAGFEKTALKYTGKDGRFLVVGHGKDIAFPLILAREVRDDGGSVVYQDLSTRLYRANRWLRVMSDKNKRSKLRHLREMVDHFGNIKLARSPKPPFGTIIYFFEAHHVPNLGKKFKQSYDLLAHGGKFIVIDYHIKDISRAQALLMFNSDREIKVRTPPGERPEREFEVHYCDPSEDPRPELPNGELYEKHWFRDHTSRGLDDYSNILESLGLRRMHSEVQPEDIPKLGMGIWKKDL